VRSAVRISQEIGEHVEKVKVCMVVGVAAIDSLCICCSSKDLNCCQMGI